MIEELHIAAAHAQRVVVRLKNGDTIMGKVQLSGIPGKAKIRTTEGPIWVPHEEIDQVERIINLH